MWHRSFSIFLITSGLLKTEKRTTTHLKELNEIFRMVCLKSSIPHCDVTYHVICDFSKVFVTNLIAEWLRKLAIGAGIWGHKIIVKRMNCGVGYVRSLKCEAKWRRRANDFFCFFNFALITPTFFEIERQTTTHLKSLEKRFRMIHQNRSYLQYHMRCHMISDITDFFSDSSACNFQNSKNIGLLAYSSKRAHQALSYEWSVASVFKKCGSYGLKLK